MVGTDHYTQPKTIFSLATEIILLCYEIQFTDISKKNLNLYKFVISRSVIKVGFYIWKLILIDIIQNALRVHL